MITNFNNWLPRQVIPYVGGFSFIIAIILDIGLFMMLYVALPHGTATWREILPGAMGAGLLWELAKKAFLLFVSMYVSISNLVYGSVAGMIAFMVWAYLSGLIFLFGAYLSFSYNRLKQRKFQLEGLKQ
jgi:membrane protein